MMMVLTGDEFASLSAATRNELLSKLGGREAEKVSAPRALQPMDEQYHGIDMVDVADLTFKQIQTWMEVASDKTKAGLRVFAEQGPVVHAQALIDAGITNTSHFQSRTTIRTRTVTGDKEAFLLGWDDWSEVEDGQGKYAVTPITHQSLRRYFQLD